MREARVGVLVIVFAMSAEAQAPDPFVAVIDRDPIELARAVDRAGDGAVLSRLDDEDRAVRLAAIQASPWMTGPEAALGRLGEIARGRDPDLAPAAAGAAARIARGIDGGTLAAREVPRETLSDARAAFDALAEDETARPDLRAAARVVVAQLEAAGVPDAP